MSLSLRTGQGKGRLRAPFLILPFLILPLPILGVLLAAPALAQPRTWPEERCARYAQSWSEALARLGRQGLGEDFLERHAAFIAAGCRGRRAVCPRSEAELLMADVMSAAAMNSGATGSFLPFACRD